MVRQAACKPNKKAAGRARPLTQDDEETDEDGGEGPHAQPENLLLLHQLTVGPREARGTEAGVAIGIVPIDASAPVGARVVQTLVSVLAALAVGGDPLAARTPVSWWDVLVVLGGSRLAGHMMDI